MSNTSLPGSTPVLVGCGDITDITTPAEEGRSPFELIAQAGHKALDDTSCVGIRNEIDTIAILRLFADSSPRFVSKLGTSVNPPRSVADRLGLDGVRHVYTYPGGNMPQYLVNHYAEEIAAGRSRAVMILGGEALRTQLAVERAGGNVSWAEDPGGKPEMIGENRPGWTSHEELHGLRAAITFYPMFENAIRGELGHSVEEHLQRMSELLERFADVARENPLATRREPLEKHRLARIDVKNRWIGFPYPRLMNSNVFVDQSSALVMTSVEVAQKLGIPRSKWVFLHGCADCTDHWHVSQRENFYASPAIRLGARDALTMAGTDVGKLAYFDIYSCFPSAIQIACQELGLAQNDPRGLTVTGGLPYFGGPGNNYVTHSISEMMRKVRAAPGEAGLVTANGYYLTKHSFGIYSTTPPATPWSRPDPAILQRELDDRPEAEFTETPTGEATIETYTVMHGKNGPEKGVMFGREHATGRRFVANTRSDRATLLRLQDEESLGRRGIVMQEDGRNIFEF